MSNNIDLQSFINKMKEIDLLKSETEKSYHLKNNINLSKSEFYKIFITDFDKGFSVQIFNRSSIKNSDIFIFFNSKNLYQVSINF